MEINKLGFIAKYMKKWLENYPNDKEEYLIIKDEDIRATIE